jgi:fatty acid desaturase
MELRRVGAARQLASGLPRILQLFTGNIGLHHVHHLNARMPNYNLQRAHDENPIFHDVHQLSLWDAVLALRLKLYEQRNGRLVTFAQARRRTARPQPPPASHRA